MIIGRGEYDVEIHLIIIEEFEEFEATVAGHLNVEKNEVGTMALDGLHTIGKVITVCHYFYVGTQV
jgi:hypothetical protein